jgi:hypothetical protein
MIKMGDRVSLFENMSKVGTVVGMYPQKSIQGMTGGTMAPLFIIKIKLDKDGSVEDHRADHVMRIDE